MRYTENAGEGPHQFLSAEEVSESMGIDIRFLHEGVRDGGGPRYIIFPSGDVRYIAQDVLDWKKFKKNPRKYRQVGDRKKISHLRVYDCDLLQPASIPKRKGRGVAK